MRVHHEAMNPPTEKAAWAVIHVGPNGEAFVVASSAAVSADVIELGADVQSVGLPQPEHTGFWLWEGVAWYDGLDGTGLDDGTLTLLSYRGAAARMSMHERHDERPDEEPETTIDALNALS